MSRKCKYEKALRTLVDQNQQFLRWLDAEMVRPSNHERGKRIAQAMNALNIAVDQVRYFTLGVDYRRDRKSAFKSELSITEQAAFLRGLADIVEGNIVPLPELRKAADAVDPQATR